MITFFFLPNYYPEMFDEGGLNILKIALIEFFILDAPLVAGFVLVIKSIL